MARVTRAEAARIMGLNRSTVSRWCQQHPGLVDQNGMVSVEELEAHRDQVINPKLQTAPAAKETPTPKSAVPVPASGMNADRARVEAAKAAGAELDLAERIGLTLRRSDVEAAIADAGERIKQAAAQMAKDRAEALSRIDDPRGMETALQDVMRDLFGALVTELGALTESDDKPDAA